MDLSTFKIVDGEQVPLTDADIAELTARQQAYLDGLVASKWANIRNERKPLLSDCDWTQTVDAPLTTEQKVAWATYRQALRDITKQTNPDNIIWPTVPF
jgi:hypothetical protein